MLSQPENHENLLVRARVLHGAHCFSALQGDYVSFKRYLEEGMESARRLDDRSLLAITLNELGIISQEQGDNSSAQAYYEESLFRAAENLRERLRIPLAPSEQEEFMCVFEAAKKSLEPKTFETALRLGKSYTLEEAIAYALHE